MKKRDLYLRKKICWKMNYEEINKHIPAEVRQRVLDKCLVAAQKGEIKNVYQEYNFQRRCYKEDGYEWKSPIECDPGLLVD